LERQSKGKDHIQYPDSPAMTDDEIMKLYRRSMGTMGLANSRDGRAILRWLGWGGAGLVVLALVLRARRRKPNVT
jgi:hypothetical protein